MNTLVYGQKAGPEQAAEFDQGTRNNPGGETDLGTKIDLGAWAVSEGLVREYTRAVGDTLPLYFECESTPPLALSAWALGRLLNRLNLPPGTIHSLQEIEAVSPVKFGERVRASVAMSKPRRRGGLEFITADLSVFSLPREGESGGKGSVRSPVLTGKTTVMVPDPPEGARDRPDHPPSEQHTRQDSQSSGAECLPLVEGTITQSQLDSYAKASGDFNPLHLDPDFAATTQFGGIIAHGMLTLALVSESLAAAFGKDWLASAGLRVRFKGAAYVGDELATRGRITEAQSGNPGSRTKCAVAVVNRKTGRELAAGNASVVVTPE